MANRYCVLSAGDGVDGFLVFMKLKRPLKGGGGKWSKR